MEIRKLEPKDFFAYTDLCRQWGTLFNSLEWLKLFEDKTIIYGMFDKANSLIGGFHLYNNRIKGIKVLSNPPYTPYIGPFFKNDMVKYADQLELQKNIMQLLADFIKGLSYQMITISLDQQIIYTHPFIWKKFKVSPQYTYIIDLSLSENSIYENMAPEKKRNIQKALQDKLSVQQVEDYTMVEELVAKTFKRQNRKLDKSHLKGIFYDYAKQNNSFAFVTYKNKNPISAVFCVYDYKKAYYLAGGYDDENKHNGAGPLAMWEAIKYAKTLGVNTFDFEGSLVPAIERYFREFGGTLLPYFKIIKAKLPLDIALKFYKKEWV